MKKAGLIIGTAGAVFAYAVWKKMQQPNFNKYSVKGKAQEKMGAAFQNDDMRVEGALNQVTGASKEVAHDIAHHTTKFVDKVLGAGSSNQVKGQAEEFIGKTTDNHMKQAEGKFDQAIGKTQAFTSDAKDKILPGEKHPKHK